MRSLLPLLIFWVLTNSSGQAQSVRQLPPPVREHLENIETINDGGFEVPTGKAWRFSDWPPRPDTSDRLIADSIRYSDSVVHSGDGSICLDLKTVGEDRILLVQQKRSVDALRPHDGRLVRLSAWIWVAQGPSGFQATLTTRKWGKPGTPPLGSRRLRLPGVRGEWTYAELLFRLRLGETTRWDITVAARQVPDLKDSPIVYIDDVRLDVLAAPKLQADLLCGRTIFEPDDILPIRISVAESALAEGLKYVRWDITTSDGLASHKAGDMLLKMSQTTTSIALPSLADGSYAVRAALGSRTGERAVEVLVPFRRTGGPFADR
ncbi:MAG: hypothetical protein HN742_34040 [Lentisphaerae bacterium]|jgi:hypothetical protein|nr:hypothetical protein [Lentisphaerota bacterium]MBT5609800.1 hypothetical protein [Lentisphaerota bacterium]MBT7053606.1 hypothetical protein [Lentisphaerota bacterium]MBT7846943.1 hypothetical protein [Lentisphaerota bacterium]